MNRDEAPRAPGLLRRIASRALQISLGLALGAGVAEGAFYARDRGAFPHLNVYVPDTRLGVRLRPGAKQSVAFNGNPKTHVRINARGFRGAEEPPPAQGDIVLLGDSQVFVLGVEEHETFSAALGRRFPDRHVLNLGVPTYGPMEYDDVLDATFSRRGGAGTTVIYTINLANDLFEANRPNRDRHVAWDGWAVRAENAPAQTTSFPGREWLFRESHAVFAWRALLHGGGAPGPLASEGTWRDLLGEASARKPTTASRELAGLVEQEKKAQRRIEAAAQNAYPEVLDTEEGKAYQRGHGNPEDIVVTRPRRIAVEAARDNRETVTQLVKGAEVRRRVEHALKQHARAEIDEERAKAVLASLAEREQIEKKIAEIEAEMRAAEATLSPLYRPLERALASCRAMDARLVVMVLPLDVMVSSIEWAKYDQEPVDMSDVSLLVEDLMKSARALGIEITNVTPALVAAEPGAFLKGDLHMTPKGHEAVAEALVEVIANRGGKKAP